MSSPGTTAGWAARPTVRCGAKWVIIAPVLVRSGAVRFTGKSPSVSIAPPSTTCQSCAYKRRFPLSGKVLCEFEEEVVAPQEHAFATFSLKDSLIFLGSRHGFELAKLVIRCVDRRNRRLLPFLGGGALGALVFAFSRCRLYSCSSVFLLDRVAVVTSITQVLRNCN
jgi:hypothetical protein